MSSPYKKGIRVFKDKGRIWGIFRDLSEEASYAEFYKYHVSFRTYLSWDHNLGLCINEGEVMSGDTPYLIVALNDIYQQVKETFIVTKPAFSILSLSSTQTIYPCMVGVRFGKAYLGSNFNNQLYYYVELYLISTIHLWSH